MKENKVATYRKNTVAQGRRILTQDGLDEQLAKYLPTQLHNPGEGITQEEIEYMKQAAMCGASINEIADALGIDHRTFSKWIEQKPGIAREWRAAVAAGRIGVKRTIFAMGMDGKFQAASMAAVNLTDFTYAGKKEEDPNANAVSVAGDMTPDSILAKMAEEINKLPEAQRVEFANLIKSNVLPTPQAKSLGLSEDSHSDSKPNTDPDAD